MKKIKKYLITSLSLLLLVALIFAISIDKNNQVFAQDVTSKITVIGTHEESFTPDTAFVTVGIETLNSSIETAQEENAKTMDNIISILKENNIEESDIKTKNYRIYEKYDMHFGNDFLGNQVLNYIEFKTKDIANLNSLLSSLVENGVNSVNGIRFCIEDTSLMYNQVLSKAIDNAKSKAKALSTNPTNLVASEITEEYTCFNDCYFDSYSLTKDAKAISNISVGEVKICASVRVVFEEK